MPKNKTISDELKFIGPVLAASTPGHPFKVPEGYFEEFSQKLIQKIKSVPGERTPGFSDVKVDHPFSIPDGYFEELPDYILSRIKSDRSVSSSEELKSISPLLSNINKKLPFTLPEGYFDDMPSNVVAGIQAIDFVQTELEILSPALAEAKHKNVYEVPAGYFDNLSDNILKRIRRPGKVVSMHFGKKLMRLAVAAAVIGFMAISFWLYNKPDSSTPSNQSIAYQLDSSINLVSDAEISNYVNNNTVLLPEATTTSSDVNPEDMKEMLAGVSDDDIREYLVKYGIETENQTN